MGISYEDYQKKFNNTGTQGSYIGWLKDLQRGFDPLGDSAFVNQGGRMVVDPRYRKGGELYGSMKTQFDPNQLSTTLQDTLAKYEADKGRAYGVRSERGGPSLSNSYKNSLKPFSSVTPFDSVVNQKSIEDFAYSRVNPEVDRMKTSGMNNLYNNLANTGGYRFGGAAVKTNDLSNQYERQRKEMAQPFIQSATDNLTNYYTDMENKYYKDPLVFGSNPNQFLRSIFY